MREGIECVCAMAGRRNKEKVMDVVSRKRKRANEAVRNFASKARDARATSVRRQASTQSEFPTCVTSGPVKPEKSEEELEQIALLFLEHI